MERQYIIALVWFAGFALSSWMLNAEHEAEQAEYTKGDQAICILLSIMSFVMVIYILAKAWATSVKSYWKKPVKPKKAE
jgi:hypothetical protein